MKYFEFGQQNSTLMALLRGGGVCYKGVLPVAEKLSKFAFDIGIVGLPCNSRCLRWLQPFRAGKVRAKYTMHIEPGMCHCYPMVTSFPEGKRGNDELIRLLK